MTPARKASIALLLLDVASVLVVFNVVSILRGLNADGHFIVVPLLGPIAALAFALYLIDGYNPRTDMLSVDYTSMHTIAVINSLLVVMLATFVVVPSGYELQSSRIAIALSYLVLTPLTLSYRRVVYHRAETNRGTRSIAFLGDDASCRTVTEEGGRLGIVQHVV